MLLVPLLLLNCNKSDEPKPDNKVIWKGVFFDGMTNTNVHDPRYNYTLIIDNSNDVVVISPTELTEEKIIAIEILSDTEMDITWELKNETQIVRTGYSYNNENELVINLFLYTVATIPFPNNLSSGTFIKEPDI
ncbi:hypothetical protein [Algibacter sp. 2305UL17-15]|uniref:hypothetical protein n=1 Tax=Algibacter sp. 2305UL17-15 TaxID=3231268 RepID=UPI003459B56F